MIRERDREAAVRASREGKEERSGEDSRDPERCPICGGPSRSVFVKKGYPIRDCLVCGHCFAEIVNAQGHVDRVYADGYFKGAGSGYADYLAEERLLVSRGKQYARILGRYTKPGSMLDVGAAAGFILKGFEEMGWIGGGIEPNATMAEHARCHLGLVVEASTLEDYQPHVKYDLIAMIQVVAHFCDPGEALKVAEKSTKPGGFWLIETWNRESWTARILGEGWHEYNPPSVLHWFSIESLRELVQDLGLREIAHGRPAKWILAKHGRATAQNEMRGTVLGKLIAGGARLVPEGLPLPYVLDDIFWALYWKPAAEIAQ